MRAFHFTSLVHALAALRNQRLKVALIDELNDPFELLCVDLADRKARSAFLEFKKFQSKRTGMLCFSKTWNNPLLWSHYADRHRGAALEFEIHEDLVEEVKYTATRHQLDVKAIMCSGGFTEAHAALIYATKSIHWAYEEEVRVSVGLSDCIAEGDRYFEPLSDRLRLVGIIGGALCDVSKAQLQRSLPAGKRIYLDRARLAFRSFNIVSNRSTPRVAIRGSA